tara:strand:- start:56 stop:730 length:675 start_codon:yes stop_codon:yes gene_type:complete
MGKFSFRKDDYEASLPDFKDVIEYLVDKHDFFSYRGSGRSMRNIDLSVVNWFLKKYKPSAFFESGIWRGRCTIIMAECIKRLDLGIPYYIAILKKYRDVPELDVIFKEYPFVEPIYSPGESAVKNLRRIKHLGMLIDGPKWRDADTMRKLYRRCERHNNIDFVVHHDILDHSLDKPNWNNFCKDRKDTFTKWYPDSSISSESKIFIDGNTELIMSAALISNDLL